MGYQVKAVDKRVWPVRHLFILFTLYACKETIPDDIYRPIPVTSADACDSSELRLRELQCKHSDGSPYHTSPKGTPFAVFCKRHTDTIHADCIARITNCFQIEAAARGACNASH